MIEIKVVNEGISYQIGTLNKREIEEIVSKYKANEKRSFFVNCPKCKQKIIVAVISNQKELEQARLEGIEQGKKLMYDDIYFDALKGSTSLSYMTQRAKNQGKQEGRLEALKEIEFLFEKERKIMNVNIPKSQMHFLTCDKKDFKALKVKAEAKK